MPNNASYSASTMWEKYSEDPDTFTDWLGAQFGYEGYYDESGTWRESDDFSGKYGMYLPTYDPYSDILARQKEDITVRYAGEAEKLKQRKSKLSAEKKTLALRDNYRKEAYKSLSDIGKLGLKSGEFMKSSQKESDIARQSSQQAGTDVLHDFIEASHNRKEKADTADLTKRASIYENKQDWYSSIMRQMTQLAAADIFREGTRVEKFKAALGDCLSGDWQACGAFWDENIGDPIGDVFEDIEDWYEDLEDWTGEVSEDILGTDTACQAFYAIGCGGTCAVSEALHPWTYSDCVSDCVNRNC